VGPSLRDSDLLLSNSQAELHHFKAILKQHVPMKDHGEASNYQGMHVTGTWKTRSVPVPEPSLPKRWSPPSLEVNHGLTTAKRGVHSALAPAGTLSSSGSSSTSLSAHCPPIAPALSLLSRFTTPGKHGAHHAGGASLRPRRSTLQAVPLLHLHCRGDPAKVSSPPWGQGSQAGQASLFPSSGPIHLHG